MKNELNITSTSQMVVCVSPTKKRAVHQALRAEAFFCLAFFDTFLAMQKVSKQETRKLFYLNNPYPRQSNYP